MIPCLACGTETVVVETRRSPSGARRRRRCPSCKARLTTMEIVVGGDDSKRRLGEAVSIISTKDLHEIVRLATGAAPVGPEEEEREPEDH